ncbi:hypothetical protein B0H67DRAFT_642002 [Lasiosphaeris hirsuta]|uniref:Uncharacterized protein n=1 Tax=Lasiosphaeris hirsuta TaxID=260670 RepID=A0AA40B156_9PEZI|nr:hypothetical protein B0H67DRAFT_642002 [Lasiosphaeris hirsuta]
MTYRFGITVSELEDMNGIDNEKQQQAQIFSQRFHQGYGSTPAMGSIWEVLVNRVNDLGSTTRLLPWNTLSLTTRESLGRLLGVSARPYYDTKYASSALVQAWLWHVLDDNLFSDPDKWATRQWKAYGTLCACLRHRAETLDTAIIREECGNAGIYAEYEFHFWRMITTRMMTASFSEDDPNAPKHTSVDRLVDRLMGKLAEIVDETESPLSMYGDKVRRTAGFAVSADIDILRARRHVMMAWRLPSVANAAAMKGHPFRESPALQDYDKVFASTGDHIDLVVSPGIFVPGEANVRFYDGQWAYPIRVTTNASLQGPAAEFRQLAMMNSAGS